MKLERARGARIGRGNLDLKREERRDGEEGSGKLRWWMRFSLLGHLDFSTSLIKSLLLMEMTHIHICSDSKEKKRLFFALYNAVFSQRKLFLSFLFICRKFVWMATSRNN